MKNTAQENANKERLFILLKAIIYALLVHFFFIIAYVIYSNFSCNIENISLGLYRVNACNFVKNKILQVYISFISIPFGIVYYFISLKAFKNRKTNIN